MIKIQCHIQRISKTCSGKEAFESGVLKLVESLLKRESIAVPRYADFSCRLRCSFHKDDYLFTSRQTIAWSSASQLLPSMERACNILYIGYALPWKMSDTLLSLRNIVGFMSRYDDNLVRMSRDRKAWQPRLLSPQS